MWRVVCVGPGPEGTRRRVVDKGPLHPDKQRALAIQDWLAKTGLYESVTLESSAGVALAAGLAKER